MKRVMYLFVLIALSAVTWGNVIPDPGFESVPLGVIPDGWDVPDWACWNGGFAAQSTIVRTGSVAIKAGLNTSDYTNLRRSYRPAGSNPSDFENKWWSFSAWVYYDGTEAGNNPATDILSIQGVVTNNWNVHRLSVGAEVPASDLVDGAWNYLEFRGKAGESGLKPGDANYDELVTNRVTILFHQNAGAGVKGTFYIDDVSAAVSTSWLGNSPEDGELVPYSDPVALSWTLPDPNNAGQDQLVNVAFWTEPNALLWQEGVNYWTLLTDSPNATSVNATPIAYDTQYWWYLGIDNSTGPLADADGLVSAVYTFTTKPSNLVPIVNAGQDQTVALVAGTALGQMAGVVTDDRLTTNTWTVTSKSPAGIADPSFDYTNALDAMVTFTELGVYVLTLTADDGEYQVSDTVTVTVLAEYPSVLVKDGGFETTAAGVIPDGGDLNIWRSFNGNFKVGSEQVRSGLQSCLIGANPLADPSWTFDRYSNLRQSYQSAFPEYEIANKTWVASAWVYYDAAVPGNGSVNDKFEFAVQIRNGWNNANIESEIVVRGSQLNSGQWNFIQVSIDVPEQNLDPAHANYNDLVRKFATVRIEQNGWAGQTGDFYIDDVSLASTDPWHNFDPTPADGDFVQGISPLNMSWTNPDDTVAVDVWFADVNDLLWTPADKIVDRQAISNVNVSVDPFKTYYWKVVAYDVADANTPSEVFTFKTLSANLPPVVNAGPDVLTYLSGGTVNVIMAGSVSDDGSTTNSWAVSGKVPQGIADPMIVSTDALNATVTLTEAGTYTLRLTANDGEYQVSDTMVIYVGVDACDAAVRNPRGFTRYPGDILFDCEVNLDDLFRMVTNWLDDNSLTGTVVLP